MGLGGCKNGERLYENDGSMELWVMNKSPKERKQE